MAAISQSFVASSSTFSSSTTSTRRSYTTRATIQIPKIGLSSTLPLIPKLTSNRAGLVEEREFARIMPKINDPTRFRDSTTHDHDQSRLVSDPTVITKMHAIMEAIADRVEMHNNIGEQRNNWNNLLLTSINAITLSAATMAGIAAASGVAALKLSSTFMYLAATGMLIIMNKIQPSQLAEEQRNASRLFKQLHCQIKTKLAIGVITDDDMVEAMEKVLALDRAYPLPLLGVMLEKFPSKVEPAVWWPKQVAMGKPVEGQNGNGWNQELEEEMREIVKVLEVKDKEDYLRLGEKALKLNKALAIAGPLLTGLGALGSMFMGSNSNSWAVIVGVLAGGMASVVNTLEHGGQVGMVFEMYRGNAGFFKLMQESIESNLKERDVERRDNGKLFEMKVALQLGRSLSELRDLAASSSTKGKDIQEFGSKLF